MLIFLISYFNLCIIAIVDSPINLEERMNMQCSHNGLCCNF